MPITLSSDAKSDVVRLGVSEEEIVELAALSAPFSKHPLANRRYEGWLFMREGDEVTFVGHRAHPMKDGAAEVRLLCDDCLADGDGCKTCGNKGFRIATKPEDVPEDGLLFSCN